MPIMICKKVETNETVTIVILWQLAYSFIGACVLRKIQENTEMRFWEQVVCVRDSII